MLVRSTIMLLLQLDYNQAFVLLSKELSCIVCHNQQCRVQEALMAIALASTSQVHCTLGKHGGVRLGDVNMGRAPAYVW